jgi:hypothetical protein
MPFMQLYGNYRSLMGVHIERYSKTVVKNTRLMLQETPIGGTILRRERGSSYHDYHIAEEYPATLSWILYEAPRL